MEQLQPLGCRFGLEYLPDGLDNLRPPFAFGKLIRYELRAAQLAAERRPEFWFQRADGEPSSVCRAIGLVAGVAAG